MAVAVDDDLAGDPRGLPVGREVDQELAEQERLVAESGGARVVGQQIR
jgi:hypothetical protein